MPTAEAPARGASSTDPVLLAASLSGLHSADVAERLAAMDATQAARVFALLPFDAAVRAFDEPGFASQRCAVLERMDAALSARLIDAMSGDQQADLFRELAEPERRRHLAALDAETRASIERLLAYPPETAGGIMTPEFVRVPADWTVARVLAHIREVGRAKETVYAVYVVDPAEHRLVGVVSLRELLLADSEREVGTVADGRRPLSVSPRASWSDVARLVSKYNLLAVPVVDEGGHVLGIVTVDDVIDELVAEQTRQVQRLGGSEALDEPYSRISFARMIRKRAGWLCALFLGEMLTATAMGYFEGEIARAVVLSLFIPLIISSGGNSGSQATSLIIRALALREVSLRDWWKIALRELPTGLVLGAILGVIGIVRILVWQHVGWYDYGPHYLLVASAVGLALVGVVAFGSLAGSMLPFVLRRLGFDPASASAPFVATLVDVTGLVIYFSVALVVLRGTLL